MSSTENLDGNGQTVEGQVADCFGCEVGDDNADGHYGLGHHVFGDWSHKVVTEHGHIDYDHVPASDGKFRNEIWWIESNKPGHGSELVDEMQRRDPAGRIAWGDTTDSGENLARRWHAAHPSIKRSR